MPPPDHRHTPRTGRTDQQMSSDHTLVVDAAHTPIGSFGGFKDVPAHELGTVAVKEATRPCRGGRRGH